MGYLRKLALLMALALAATAVTAATASATINDDTTGSPYNGSVTAVNTGTVPTLQSGTTTISCDQAAITNGTVDGTASTGVLNFTFGPTCQTNGLVGCTVDPVANVPVSFNESIAPDAIITNTATRGTTIVCGGVFNCTATSTATVVNGTGPVTAVTEAASAVSTIDDTVDIAGAICPDDTGNWTAQYLITATTNPATLSATG